MNENLTPEGQQDQPSGQPYVWNVPPQHPGGPYQPPYSTAGQPPQPQQADPYEQDGWRRAQQDGRNPAFDVYQPSGGGQPPKKKGKGLKVFGIILGSAFGVLLLCFAGVGVWSTMGGKLDQGRVAAADGSSSMTSDQAANGPVLTLENKPADVNSAPGADGLLSTELIVEQVEPSVVAITTYINYQSFQASGMGSGIILSEDGYIVTNSHVLEGANGITVLLNDETSYEGRLVAADQRTDLAIIKVEASGLSPAKFGNSDEIRVGETVIAIGNPQSMEYFGSVTQGIVSGLNRKVTAVNSDGSSPITYTNLIQTDAAINPGNSGGALVNRYGQVVGINSAKSIATGIEGIGFAIPINDAKPVVDDLIKHQRVTGRVRLGITGSDVNAGLAQLNGVPTGVRVISTEEGTDIASKGVLPGDILTKVDGTAIAGITDLSTLLEGKKPGDTVKLDVYRMPSRSSQRAQNFAVDVVLMEDMGVTQMPQTQQQMPAPQGDPNQEALEDFFNQFFN